MENDWGADGVVADAGVAGAAGVVSACGAVLGGRAGCCGVAGCCAHAAAVRQSPRLRMASAPETSRVKPRVRSEGRFIDSLPSFFSPLASGMAGGGCGDAASGGGGGGVPRRGPRGLPAFSSLG